jgi:putative peptidoglycan lipid II flippase
MPRAVQDSLALMQPETPALGRGRSHELLGGYALSRTLGLSREVGVAVVFGTTVAADQLSAGLIVASLAALIISEMVFATHVRRAGNGEPSGSLSWRAMAALGLGISLLYVIPGSLVTLAILPSMSLRDVLTITLCLCPSVGFVAAAGLANAVLTLDARIARVNLAQACWSAGALIGLLAAHEFGGGVSDVAAGWSAGCLAGFLLATHWARAVHPLDLGSPRPILDLRVAAPVALAFGLISVQGLVDRAIASRLGEGSVAALGYADRLFLLPVGFVTSVIAPVVLAAVVRHRRDARGAEGSAVVTTSARLLKLALPASFALFAGCPIIVDVVLAHGAFNAESAHLTIAALDGLAISIAATSLALVLYRAMQAVLPLGDLARVAGAALLASALLSVVLAFPLGLRGVTLGTALAATLAVALQSRRLGIVFGAEWDREFRARVLTPAIAWTALGCVMCAAVDDVSWLRPVAGAVAVVTFGTLNRRVRCSS